MNQQILDALEARADHAREQMMRDQQTAHVAPAPAHQAKQRVDWTPLRDSDGTPLAQLEPHEQAYALMCADMQHAHLAPTDTDGV